MAENDSDKTVKITTDATQSSLTPPKANPQNPGDQTLKLGPSLDQTVKLSAVPSPAAQPSAPPQQKPPEPPLVPPPAPKGKFAINLKYILASILVILILMGSTWYFVPNYFTSNAEKLSKQGQHDQAAQKLRWALYFFPRNAESISIQLGQALRLSKDYANAQKILDKILLKNPNQIAALKELGQTYNESGQQQKALESFQKLIQLNPADTEAMQWAGDIAYETKNYAIAMANYESLSKSGKTDAVILQRLGISYFETGKMEESRKTLLSALEKDKNTKGVNELLAKIYLSQNQYTEAANAYQQELSLSPNDPNLTKAFADACHQAGNFYLGQKNTKEAITAFQQGLTVSSDHAADFHYQLAKLFAGQKNKSEFFNHLSQAIQLNPQLKVTAKIERSFTVYRRLPQFRKIVR